MCGISGILSSAGSAVAPAALAAMNESLLHRGPDGAGSFARDGVGLAMRRLSIIGVANGDQPIYSEDGAVAVVANGEIYNYRDLRRELRGRGHRFRTESDVEVVVHLWEEHGPGLLERLRGMFALALYDARTGTLLLARDRAGKKPLYYAEHGGTLVFASEIKALHASGLVPKVLDAAGLAAYLTYGFVPGERTLFADVRRVPAGSCLTAGRDGTTVRRFWDFPAADPEPPAFEAAAARVRELLEEAVRLRLMSEVPLGAFLSGGVDSSTIVGILARRFGLRVTTFCVGFEDSALDELAHARAVAEHFGTDHHEVIVERCGPELLRQIVLHNDEPPGDPAAVPTFCLARFARRRITVALTGEGGDELFAGYPHYELCRRLAALERRTPALLALAGRLYRWGGAAATLPSSRLVKGAWIASLPAPERVRAWSSALTDAELDRLLRPELRRNGAGDCFEAAGARSGGGGELARLLYADSKLTLADQLLMKVDKMTMAASLEARCPLLDQELLDYVGALPVEMKISERGSKLLLRHAVRDLVPAAVLERPKQGFDVPLLRWLLRDLEPVARRLVLAPGAPLGRYLDLGRVRSLWAGLGRRHGARLARQAWRILNLALWHELHWPAGGGFGGGDEDRAGHQRH